MHSWLIHACVTTDASILCYSEEPAKQTDYRGVISAQGRGVLIGFVT